MELRILAWKRSPDSPQAGAPRSWGAGRKTETTEGEEVEFHRSVIMDALAFHALRGYSKFESPGGDNKCVL